MGEVPVPQEHVADMDPAHADVVEPVVFPVALSLELVGTGIGDLNAPLIDHSEVDESTEGLLHVHEQPVQLPGIPKLPE
jgi:hypothetical protein